jgi:hypothetical protein
MSATAPQAPAAPAPTKRSTGRIVAMWIGGIVAVVGALIAIGGGAAWAVFGSDGVLTTGRGALATPTTALMSGTATINDTAGASDVLGDTTVHLSARSDTARPVFVGVGPATAVRNYLAGAPADEITDVDVNPFRVTRTRLAGTRIPAAPVTQRFWVARGTGRTANLNWKVRDGDFRVVVMNADGGRAVATQTRIGIDVPYLPGVAIGILIGGLLIMAAGVATIVVAGRRPRRVAA